MFTLPTAMNIFKSFFLQHVSFQGSEQVNGLRVSVQNEHHRWHIFHYILKISTLSCVPVILGRLTKYLGINLTLKLN